jgi:hypothetical protein
LLIGDVEQRRGIDWKSSRESSLPDRESEALRAILTMEPGSFCAAVKSRFGDNPKSIVSPVESTARGDSSSTVPKSGCGKLGAIGKGLINGVAR